MNAVLSTQEKYNRLRLIRSENVGAITFFSLLKLYGSATEALCHIEHLSLKGGKNRPIQVMPEAEAEKEWVLTEKMGAQLLFAGEPLYPPLLREIEDAPPVLTVMGQVALLEKNAVAMVGARNASTNACHFGFRLAKELGTKGWLVVSGLARGIDAAVHSGAIDSGTAAVIAGGMDNIYPPENERLQRSIAEKGLVITEMPLGSKPKAQHFPRRNRIIAGMSLGTVVVEAAVRSGSLITARLAAEYGREVFAVPGFPLDPRSSGANKLLKEGATLVESAEDIVQQFTFMNAPLLLEKKAPPFVRPEARVPVEQEVDKARAQIVQSLSFSPTEVDAIIRQTGVPVNIVLAVLLELELAGRLERHAGNRVALIGQQDNLAVG